MQIADLGDALGLGRVKTERVRLCLLITFKWLSVGAVVVFTAGWVAAFLIHPSPHWLFPAMVAVSGLGFGSTLLYHVANRSFTEPIESTHSAIETPTTVRSLVRQNWIGPAFLWIVFSVVAIAILRDQVHLSTATALPAGLLIGTALSLGFVFLHARGWVGDE